MLAAACWREHYFLTLIRHNLNGSLLRRIRGDWLSILELNNPKIVPDGLVPIPAAVEGDPSSGTHLIEQDV